MTDHDTSLPLDDCIDRIVDGDLTAAELRAIVARLDSEPAGWKRCAVAFLEAQCWREAMRDCDESTRLGAEGPRRNLALGAAPPRRARRPWLRHAAAAGLITASFGLGWLGHAMRPAATTHGAYVTAPGPTLARNENAFLRASDHTPGIDPDVGSLPDSRPRIDNQPRRNPTPVIATVARLNFGPAGSRAEVPILAGPGINEEWLKRQPPPVSEHGQVVFQRHGYQVDQRRQLITTVTADGRRIAIPINQVLIRYTGNQAL
jgi:hypothetical protein